MSIFKKRPSPAMIVAIAALSVSLVGTAVAGPIAEISLNRGEKQQVRKISRNISGKVSNRRISKRAPGLNVATARNAVIANVASASVKATNAQNAESADSADTVVDGAITTEKLADAAVNSAKLDANAVHADDLGPITIRTETVSVGAESTDFGTVSCLAGEKMLSGGGGFNIFTAPPHPQVITSQSSSANTWLVRAFNPAAFSRNLTVQAVCLND